MEVIKNIDKIIYRCKKCGKEYDRVEKALDCEWEDDNILTTIQAMKSKYDNKNILTDMIKLYSENMVKNSIDKTTLGMVVYCYSLEKFLEGIYEEGFVNKDGFSITHEFSSDVDLKPYLWYYNKKISDRLNNNRYEIICYECDICSKRHGGIHYHVELVDVLNTEYYDILKKEGKI